jgi:hypothetical protein
MPLLSARKKQFLFGLTVALLVAGAGLAWVGWKPVWSWYCLRGLSRADEGEREAWIGRVAGLGERALPALLELLARDEEQNCANATAALGSLCRTWPAEDPRWTDLTARLSAGFGHFSRHGRAQIFTLAGEWLQSSGEAAPPRALLLQYTARLIVQAAQIEEPELHAATLDMAGALLAQEHDESVLGACRDLARICLRDKEARNRARAARLTLYPALGLLEHVVPLLQDGSPEVRRVAVLAVGRTRAVVSDENLALSLHDSDAEVRRLCEKALRGRGLTPRHVQLARLVTDSRPAMRLQILYYLREESDLDVTQWLRLLSQDPAEAVRLAAVRAAVEQGINEMTERIGQMAQSDPSPTVCQWARYYLACQKQRQASLSAP